MRRLSGVVCVRNPRRALIVALCALGMLQASVALRAHAQEPVLLMLRASYYYDVDVDPLGAQPTREPATEAGQPKKRLSRGARIAIGITVPIVVLGAGVGIAAALSPGLSVEVQP